MNYFQGLIGWGLLLLVVPNGFTQQIADPLFDASVKKPAYSKNHPKVLFDEAHHNFYTAAGRYKPFADLLRNDGYSVVINKDKFQRATLKNYQILVIANALGADRQNDMAASNSPFSDAECEVVRQWVRGGGSLLLIAGPSPFSSAADKLAHKLGVDMSKGRTIDEKNYDTGSGTDNKSFLVFSISNKLLADSPITLGRNVTERINRVISFSGQSLKGPPNSVDFLLLSDSARDRPPADRNSKPEVLDKLPNGQTLPPGVTIQRRPISGPPVSAAGRTQGTAFGLGKGRVVVLGEAAMLSAQVVYGVSAQVAGLDEIKIGMNRKGIDNKQLALNIAHWLSRLIN